MRGQWHRELLRVAGWLLAALAVGLVTSRVLLVLLAAALAYAAWHAYWLWRLHEGLVHRRREPPPEAPGIWGDVFQLLYRRHRRNQKRKQRIARLLRAFSESTDAMPDGTVVLNAHWQIRWFNEAAARLLGLAKQQDVGQHVGNLVRHPAFTRYLAAADFREAIEIPAPLDAGTRLSLRIVPYGDGERLLLVRDVTRADRMSATIRDLLELSRLETEAPSGDDREIHVQGMLARIRDEALAMGIGPRDVVLDFRTDVRLRGVEREIYSAFSNLVFNAMRYTPESGCVRLTWYLRGDQPCLSVADTGTGIAKEHLPRLTERFYRVDPGRGRATGGTGLGLAIVKHALQRHGARLEIESTPGEGSEFTCVFPPERAIAAAA